MQTSGPRANQVRASAPLDDGNVDSCHCQLAGQHQARRTSPGDDHSVFDIHLRNPRIAEFWLRPAILPHDPGLAASPGVRYKVKWDGVISLRSFFVSDRRLPPYDDRVIALVCAMPMELRPLRRRLRLRKTGPGYAGRIGDHAVIAAVIGIGPAPAAAATARLLDTLDAELVIVVGIAGATENQTPIGTLVLPQLVTGGPDGAEYRPAPLGIGNAHGTLCTTDQLLLDPVLHADLRAHGVVALDMETAAVAKVCTERGVPWSVVRAISDRVGDGTVDADIAGLTHPDGRPNLMAAARYVITHPGALPRLIRLAKAANLAAERAAEAAIKFLTESR
jgi:adenosylhomocysteine nucleosidase